MARFLILLVRGYQRFLSPLKIRTHCIYTPTCSQYAIEALKKVWCVKGYMVGLQKDTEVSSICRRRL